MVVVSYMQDAVIAVAAESRALAKYVATEGFKNCCTVAGARNLGFPAIKTEWIGFGDLPLDALDLGDRFTGPVEVMRVLGYRFNSQLNWSAHVDYSLRHGRPFRNRISAVSSRFGDVSGAGVWETFGLFQGVYLPTVYIGLEFVGDFAPYVKRIKMHVNDTLRHLFHLPFRLVIFSSWLSLVPPLYIYRLSTSSGGAKRG